MGKKPDFEAAFAVARKRAEEAATEMRLASTEIDALASGRWVSQTMETALRNTSRRLRAAADALVAEIQMGDKHSRRWALWLAGAAIAGASAVGAGVEEAVGSDLWGAVKHHLNAADTSVQQTSSEVANAEGKFKKPTRHRDARKREQMIAFYTSDVYELDATLDFLVDKGVLSSRPTTLEASKTFAREHMAAGHEDANFEVLARGCEFVEEWMAEHGFELPSWDTPTGFPPPWVDEEPPPRRSRNKAGPAAEASSTE